MKATKKDFDIKKNRMESYLLAYSDRIHKELNELTKADYEMFILNHFKSVNRSSFYQSMKVLNTILSDLNVGFRLDSSDYVKKCVDISEQKYYTKREIQNICNMFQNAQDRFLIYSLFNGIYGKNYSEIINMKTEQIAKDFSYITLSDGTKFVCDDYMKDILSELVEECYYYSYTLSEVHSSRDIIELNMSSEYLLKPMPTKRNSNGLGKISNGTVQRRLDKLSEVTESDLSGKSLIRSGVIYKLFELESFQGSTWGYNDIVDYLKLNGISGSPEQIYKSYHKKYHGTETNIY